MKTKLIRNEEVELPVGEQPSLTELEYIPYQLIEEGAVPDTPLMRYLLFLFELCRHRYVEMTESMKESFGGSRFDNDKFLYLLRRDIGISFFHHADWTSESMKELMLAVEAEIDPEHREKAVREMEDINELSQDLFEIFVIFNQHKKLTLDTNPAFTSIDFDELNDSLYDAYSIYLSAADRRSLGTIGSMIRHIVLRISDGRIMC